jgi:hypothetical protein
LPPIGLSVVEKLVNKLIELIYYTDVGKLYDALSQFIDIAIPFEHIRKYSHFRGH